MKMYGTRGKKELLVFLIGGFLAVPVVAELPQPAASSELIVLLRAKAPGLFLGPAASDTPRIVSEINAGNAPGGLGIGNPTHGRVAIHERARGRMGEWIEHNPDTPGGRLQRYIVLTYPEHANIEAIEMALVRNPNIESVTRNLTLQLHTMPSDSYVGTGAEDPEDAQWGVHALNLPEAWDWTTGHAYLGIIDEGLETGHPDLRVSHEELGFTVFDGGGFRAHLSRDVLNHPNCSVDEIDPTDTYYDPTPGHGSHVTGIAAAATDNGIGVAGACWNCSVLMTKVSPIDANFQTRMNWAAEGLDFLARRGSQIINMSLGTNKRISGGLLECVEGSHVDFFCDVISLADNYDIAMVASSGNDRYFEDPDPVIDFPAFDPRTIAAGGLEFVDHESDPVLWVNESCYEPFYCGSCIGPGQDLMAPAQDVLSTVYTGYDHITSICGDSNFPTENGYGRCTGTSMSAPLVSGIAGLVRSVNPLLSKEDVRDVLTSTASIPGTKDPELGHGIPDAGAAVVKALGTVSGNTLPNRLTPLFGFYSPPPAGAALAETHVLTTVPQFGSAFLLEDVRTFNRYGPTVSSYAAFPGFCTNAAPDCCPKDQPCCVGLGSDCVPKILVDANTNPGAWVFVFTNDLLPTSTSPPLVPLYRLRYESALSESCPSPFADPISSVRDFAYATSIAEVETYLNGAALNGVFKYKLDGIEGYVYEHCDSGCPPKAVSIHRLYDPSRHDTILVPKSQVAAMKSQGYLAPADPDLPEVVGYAFENVDSDGDGLIDGFEELIGSDFLNPDSDGDAVSDGAELLVYDRSSPDPALHGYQDPCSNGCPMFADGFESGDTSAWSN